MKEYKIRRAKLLDLDRIIELQLDLQSHLEKSSSRIWRYTYDREEELRQQFKNDIQNENVLLLVAEVEEKTVGFAQGTVMHRTDYLPNIIGMLSTIYVDQKFRRQGIGNKMVYEICKFFKANKVEKVYLRYVIGNIEGEKFWKDLGFKKILVSAGTDINIVEKNLQRKVKN